MASLVNHSVTNLINGVSQQASSVRLDNQVEEQVNCFSDVTKGLTIRNPIELISVLDDDISGQIPIEFNLDGENYTVFMDTLNNTLTHIPLSADIDQLAASISSPSYFSGASKDNIKVVEDKDNVYVLNTTRKVGSVNSYYSYFDISITNTTTKNTDTNWSSGGYNLTISSTTDPESSVSAVEPPLVIPVTSSTTLSSIASTINGSTIVNEVGEVTLSGDISNYRLTFVDVPTNYLSPTVTTIETSPIYFSGTVTTRYPEAGFYNQATETAGDSNHLALVHWEDEHEYWYYYDGQGFDPSPSGWRVEYSYKKRTSLINANDFIVVSVDNWQQSVSYNNITYYKGSNTPYRTGYSSRKYYPTYSLAQENRTDNYTVSTSELAIVSAEIDPKDTYGDEAMVWITGVSSEQTYTLRIVYENASGVLQPDAGPYTVNVGSTVSNIKLNWVANALRVQVDEHANWTASVSDLYENAFLIKPNVAGQFRIRSVIITNNFDNTSTNSVLRATVNNESSIEDVSNLPANFIDGFKLRVGTVTNDSSNYYLVYDSSFEGWRETGLDSTRRLDALTLPYIISKDAVRTNREIILEPNTWSKPASGDYESNPEPSFFNRQLRDVFFYGSRLGLATSDTLVMSKINDSSTFYRDTTSSVIDSDRVDIKLDSSKTGFANIKNVMNSSGKLLINTGISQSELVVNTSFDLSTARLTQVSSYPLGDAEPLPVNNSLYFPIGAGNYSNVYSYSTNNQGYFLEQLTKHIPKYIKGNVLDMVLVRDTVFIRTDDDLKVLYVQNRYSTSEGLLQNAWHRWELSEDILHIKNTLDSLSILCSKQTDSGGTKLLVGKYDIDVDSVDTVEDDSAIGWRPYFDFYTTDKAIADDFASSYIAIGTRKGDRYEDIDLGFDSTLVYQTEQGASDGPYYSLTTPAYYWKRDGNTNSIIFNDESEIVFGNSGIATYDHAGYRYTVGEQINDTEYFKVSRSPLTDISYYTGDMTYGVPFKTTLKLSQIIPRQQASDGSYTAMNFATLMLRRMRLNLGNSGVFSVTVDFEDRQDYTAKYTGQPLGKILLGTASVSDINFKFPINGKSDKISITIESDSSMPFNLLSYEWQGRLTQRGRNI